jgi:hypothetical protein
LQLFCTIMQDEELSEYEQDIKKKIAENQEFLNSLQLLKNNVLPPTTSVTFHHYPKPPRKPVSKKLSTQQRKSLRISEKLGGKETASERIGTIRMSSRPSKFSIPLNKANFTVSNSLCKISMI